MTFKPSPNLPSPGIPIQADKPGDVPTAAARIDMPALMAKVAIPEAKLAVGDRITDSRTGKYCEIAGIGVRAGVPVYLVRFADGDVLRNQDEFDEAQAGGDITIDITPGPMVAP